MRREELFMDILGRLDEKYVSMAMPRSCGHSTVGDTGNVIEIKPVEVSPEVSRKDLRIYWITRTLGMAAAAALIVGAAVIFIMNWDKIAVRGSDTPPVVTTYNTTMTEPTITFTDSTTSETSSELTGHEITPRMEAAWKLTNDYMYGLLFSMTDDDVKDTMRASCRKEPDSVTVFEAPQGAEEPRLYVYDNMPLFGYNAEMGAAVSDSRGLTQVDYTIEAKSEPDTKAVYEKLNNKLTEMLGQPDSSDDTYSSWDVMETGICFDLQKIDDHHVKFFMYNKNIGKDNDIKTTAEKETEPVDTTTDKNTETTTSKTDETADTTAPAEEQPSDDELKALVEQGAEACGLKITVSDLTKASLKLNYSIDESVRYADKLEYTWYNRYQLETPAADGSWVVYDPDNVEKTTWWDGLFDLGGDWGNETTEKVSFYGQYSYDNEIPNGHYRIVKNLSVTSTVTWQKIGYLPVYAEFDITDDIPNLFDIAISVKDATPDGAVLVVTHGGHNYFHDKVKLGFYSRIVTQRLEDGRWNNPASDPTTSISDSEITPLKVNDTTQINVSYTDTNGLGSLGAGTYRMMIWLVNYAGTGSKKDDILNCSVYYSPEFEITNGEREWGITMSAKDVTAEGLTLVISQRGGSYTGELEYGEPYSIERKNGDKWEPVKFLNDEVAWIDLAYDVESNSDKEEKLDWKWLYGTLPAGTYRIAKEFTDYRAPGDSDTQMYYAAFRITDDMASKLGVALRAKKYNARKMTLQIVQTGDTGYEKIGTNPHRYTIERKTDGIWQSYYAPQAGVPTPDLGLKVKNSGVTEYKLDWSEAAGSLPVGDYRLGMTFSCGDITETRYCEFTIEESMTNEFGISINVLETSKTGVKLGIDSRGADMSGRAYYDKDLYTIEKKGSGGKWKNVVSAASGEMHTGMISLCESGYAGHVDTINWSGRCGELAPGNYRISLKFYTGSGDSYKEIMLYAEFDITADTPETLSD